MDIGICSGCYYWFIIKCRCVCFGNYLWWYYFYIERINRSCIFYWYDVWLNDIMYYFIVGNLSVDFCIR